jgi:L-threonylcarbamoyladenylate synthase
MQIISNCTQDVIKKAAKALTDGHLVAFPTETVYGLGADATNEKAVSRIYSVKGRPSDHPLIVHISSINGLDDWATQVPEYAVRLATQFWPGPLTLILPRKPLAQDFITGGQENVGLRVPSHPVALELLRQFEALGGKGVSAPSANRFGAVSPTTASAVHQELGEHLFPHDLIIDGGQSIVGIESTIVDCTKTSAQILRPGAVTTEMIKAQVFLGGDNPSRTLTTRVSGQDKKHYSPKALVKINELPTFGEGFIALNTIKTPKGVIRLASPSNSDQFARQLYAALRMGDDLKLSCIVVNLPTGIGLAEAICDRILKAAGSGVHDL